MALSPLSRLRNGILTSVAVCFLLFLIWLSVLHSSFQHSVPAGKTHDAVAQLFQSISLGASFLFVVSVAAILLLLKKASESLERLSGAASKALQGDFTGRFSTLGNSDVARLEAAVEELSMKLEQTAASLEKQRHESDAVFRVMSEGVIAIDREERILGLNESAAWLLNRAGGDASGKMLHELVRSTQLPQFVQNLFLHGESSIPEIQFRIDDEELTLSLKGKVLAGSPPEGAAAILVFEDLTQIKRLENVRRDFVANVSHELRTPITSIKGFVETLLEGAMENPSDRQRFLEIILRHTKRLNDIIDDLLSLARLESASESTTHHYEKFTASEILRGVVEFCRPTAAERQIELIAKCERDTSIYGSRLLIEQALINLVINGIKYSQGTGPVSIVASSDEENVTFNVEDRGIGISREHLPRIFERFYRVDRARTREEGGSGLGLSIVKHIALAHGGDVRVASELGNGSTFSLRLPAAGIQIPVE